MRADGVPVRHGQRRVRRRLDPDDVGVRRGRPRLVVLDVAEPPRLERPQQDRRPEVGALGQGDRRAGPREGEQHRGLGGHAGGEEKRLAAFELAESRLAGRAGRVGVALVEELAWIAVLVVRPDRRTVDGLHRATVAAADAARDGYRSIRRARALVVEQRVERAVLAVHPDRLVDRVAADARRARADRAGERRRTVIELVVRACRMPFALRASSCRWSWSSWCRGRRRGRRRGVVVLELVERRRSGSTSAPRSRPRTRPCSARTGRSCR